MPWIFFLAQTVQEPGWSPERVFALLLQALGVISTILAIVSVNSHGKTKEQADKLREEVAMGQKVIGILSPAAAEHATPEHVAQVADAAKREGVEDHPAIVAVTK